MKKTIVTKAILLSLLVTLLGVVAPTIKVNSTQAYSLPDLNLVQPKSDLELCLEAKGWLGTPTKYMLSQVDTYCADYPSILSMTKRPSLEACEMVSGSMKFNNDENILLYREVCNLIYPGEFSIPKEDTIVVDNMCTDFNFTSDSASFTSFGNDTNVTILNLKLRNDLDYSVSVDNLNIAMSGIYSDYVITGARLTEYDGALIGEGNVIFGSNDSIRFTNLDINLAAGLTKNIKLKVDTGSSSEFYGETIRFTLDESILVNLETTDDAVCEEDLSNTISIASIDA